MMEEERLQCQSSASNSRQMHIENLGEIPVEVDLTSNQGQKNSLNGVEVNEEQSIQTSIANEMRQLDNQQNVQQSASEQYWQSKKSGFVEEFNRLLIQGIDQTESLLYPMPQDTLSQKINDTNIVLNDQTKIDQQSDQEKKLIRECCLWLVEGKNGSEYDLIKLCTLLKEYAEQQLSSQIPSILTKNIDYYRDIIAECAEKKNYGMKLTKDISTLLTKLQNASSDSQIPDQVSALRVGQHEVWEIKEIQSLSQNAKIEEIDFIRKKRRQHQALLKGLEKLIKAIEKGKGEDEAFSAYQKTANNPPKMKIQTKINGKTNGAQKSNQVDKSIEDNLKKMKIDSGNNTPVKPGDTQIQNGEENGQLETKTKKKPQKKQATNKKPKEIEDPNNGQQNEQEGEDATKQSVCEISANNSINPEQAKQINTKKNQNESKKAQQPAPANPKDNSQKKLFSFFKKNNNPNIFQDSQNNSISLQTNQTNDSILPNPESSIADDKNIEQQPASKPAKSILRKIGGADPRPQHLQTSDKIQDIKELKEVFQTIKNECKEQWKLLKKKKQNQSQTMMTNMSRKSSQNKANRRKILVTIHDYVRQYKNVFFDQKSKYITPRNFLTRDDDLIQYDMDSEDELQELNAENIENEEDDMDEEDFEDDDSAKQFIVPDGYLSDEGFDSDKEDVFDQKKLTFQNYNFAENANKQGFIFQEKDKAGDVQNFLINYRAKKYDDNEVFPLCLKKKTAVQDGQAQSAAPIVWTNERLKQFIRVVHGSYQPKKVLLEQIAKIDIMKEVSKNRLEKKFKEIIQKDDKQEGEAIKRWCVHLAVIESLEFEENEMEELKKQRQEEYKSTRQNKKEEKISTQQQIAINTGSAPLNNNQLTGGVQQQIKPIVGFNIFSSAAPLKKNMNITPIKSVLASDDEEEKQELEKAQARQNQRIQEEQQKKEQQYQEQQQQQQIINQQQEESKVEQKKQNGMIEENSQNGMSQSSNEQRVQSRKNSASINENSNTSQRKQKMLQTTLSFAFKKS